MRGGFWKKLWKFLTHHDAFIVGNRLALHAYGEIVKAIPLWGTLNEIVAAYYCGPCASVVAGVNAGVQGGSTGDIFKAVGLSLGQSAAFYAVGDLTGAFAGAVGTSTVGQRALTGHRRRRSSLP